MVDTNVKNKQQTATLRTQNHRLKTCTLAFCVLLVATCSRLYAETTVTVEDTDFFIPDDLHFYNPLKHSDGTRKIAHKPNATGMDNDALTEAAEYFRNNDMNAAQRALNYRWLRREHDDMDLDLDGKVLSKIFRMGFKTYWRNTHKDFESELNDDDIHGSLSEEMSYGLRVSGRKLKFSFEYEF